MNSYMHQLAVSDCRDLLYDETERWQLVGLSGPCCALQHLMHALLT